MKRKLFLLLCALLTSVGMWADVDYARAFSNAAWEGSSGVQKNAFPLQNSVNMGECYYTSFSTGSAMSQTVTGLPNGKYTVEVYAQAHHANISGYNPETMVNVNTLKVNSSTEALATVNNNGFVDGEPTLHTFDDVSVTDGTLTISINRDANGANWFTASVKSVVYKGTSDYADYTSLIQNPSFESDASNWDTSKSSGSNVGLVFPANANFRVSGDKYAERYQPNGTVDVRQTVTAPKTGLYRVGVGAYARGSEISSAKLFANGQEASITAINRYSVTIYVEKDADIEFGVTATGNGGGTCWFAFDDFSLEYLGTDLTYKIANPSFSSAYTNGWTLDGTAPNDYNSTYGTYEAYHLVGGLHQDITGLPNGVYKVTMQASERVDGGSHAFNLYATTSSGTTKSTATVASHTNFNTMAQTMYNDPTYARIETYAVVTNGNLTLGHYESNGNTWPVFDNYTLTYCSADAAAYTLFLTNEAPKANSNISAMAASDVKTAMSTAYSTKSVTATQENCQWITYVESSGVELKEASYLEVAADAIANVAYKETTSGSHATYVSAINDFVTSVTEATTTSEITTAISTLKSAIKTYINNAEPLNEGESFEITCLITNPKFADNTITGWTRTVSSGGNAVTNYGCNEFWNNTFNFYQDLAELPNGSYQLSVQAYCRPGGNDTAYPAYRSDIDNTTAELYVNSDASRVGNIYAYKNQTTATEGRTFHCNVSPDDYYVPDDMKSASVFFSDEDVYKTTVAALVNNNTLTIGFRDESLTASQWTIFSNFRLYYYGSSKMIYYKQYLPQLEAEIKDNYLNNGAYAVLKAGQTERTALATANAADAEGLDTEEELQGAIDDIIEARDNFVAAKGEYDNLSAKITTANSYSNNKGEGVFQITNAAWSTLESQITTSQGVYDTGTTSKASVTTEISTLNTAINTATSTLNAPDAEKRYWVSIVEDGKDWDGNAVTFIPGGRNDQGKYAIKYLAPSNANLCQALKFTAVEGNKYKISAINTDGTEQYITTNHLGEYGSNKEQIRTTEEEEKALEVEIKATATEGQFQLYNTDAKKIIANNNNNDMYTAGNCNFTIAVASKAAAANLTVKSGKLGTFIAPFKVTLPAKVKAYSATANNTQVTLEKFKNGGEDLPAGTPVIIYGDGEDTSVDFDADYSAVNGNKTVGALTGILDNNSKTITSGNYVLQTKGETQAFYLLNEDAAGKLNRCYVTAEESDEARLVISFDDDDPTAINAIEAASEEAEGLEDGKYLIDGKIVIVKNGVKYSANGQILK